MSSVNFGIFSPMVSNKKIYCFEVHEDSNEVTVAGERLKLSPKEMGVLMVLKARAGHTVSRLELLQEVWGDTQANDQGLTQVVSSLRQVFARSTHIHIKTVPKKGYQLQVSRQPIRRFGLPTIRVNLNILVMLFLLLLIVVLVFVKRIEIRVDRAPEVVVEEAVNG